MSEFAELSPEARAELGLFKRWLELPKPRESFEEYCKKHALPAKEDLSGSELADLLSATDYRGREGHDAGVISPGLRDKLGRMWKRARLVGARAFGASLESDEFVDVLGPHHSDCDCGDCPPTSRVLEASQ